MTFYILSSLLFAYVVHRECECIVEPPPSPFERKTLLATKGQLYEGSDLCSELN